jgi:SprT protein
MSEQELLERAERVKQEFIQGLKNTIIYHLINRTKECKIVVKEEMRTTAGTAYYKANTIHLNKKLFTENINTFNQTIGHEVAHLINYEVYGKRGHGPTWKNVMIMMGLEPRRCHSYKVERRSHKPVAYGKCECRADIPIKTRRYNKILRGAKYKCTGCNSELQVSV